MFITEKKSDYNEVGTLFLAYFFLSKNVKSGILR